ncbi:MAG: M48 family metallopeptidase [Nitrospirae bacterium]|nr:M48 family metallopeptidase [Nitrospirota bacterium]
MIEFTGDYFDGRTSRPVPAVFACDGPWLMIRDRNNSLLLRVGLKDCSIDPPLGRTARTIRLPGNAVCETFDHDAVAALEKTAKQNPVLRLVHAIEASRRAVLLSLVGIILSVWLFHTFVIPSLAGRIAFSLPAGIADTVSSQTLKVLDSRLLQPSGLDADRTAALRTAFDRIVAETGSDASRCRLEFRKSPVVGPNAFALPSGLVVMTDELVALAETDEELEAILYHELAHVRNRHALRMVVQDAGIFLVVSALAGDLSGISSAAASLPTVLAQSGYSREFEREADRFAVQYLIRRKSGVIPFQDILRRISKTGTALPGEAVFSTHPVMEDRLQDIEKMKNALR